MASIFNLFTEQPIRFLTEKADKAANDIIVLSRHSKVGNGKLVTAGIIKGMTGPLGKMSGAVFNGLINLGALTAAGLCVFGVVSLGTGISSIGFAIMTGFAGSVALPWIAAAGVALFGGVKDGYRCVSTIKKYYVLKSATPTQAQLPGVVVANDLHEDIAYDLSNRDAEDRVKFFEKMQKDFPDEFNETVERIKQRQSMLSGKVIKPIKLIRRVDKKTD